MLEQGMKAPDFTLLDKDGNAVSLSDFLGKRIVLYFYPKDMTSGCTKQACNFASLYPQFREKDAIVIGEVWEDATNKVSYGMRKCYFNGWELDSVMNYPVQKAIIAYLAHGDFAHLRRTLESIYGHYPPEAANTLMNLLGSHDTEPIVCPRLPVSARSQDFALRSAFR